MSTIYLRMPSRAAADQAGQWTALPCPFAIAGNSGRVETSGVQALSVLATEIARAQRVVMIVAASDVSLVQVQVPPMSPAKLRAALPNLVEDQLISDPSECVLVVTGSGTTRSVAVMQRAWLDVMARTLLNAGARKLSAVPAQLCLPLIEGATAAALLAVDDEYELALRSGPHAGLGLPIVPDSRDTAAAEALDTLATLAPGPVELRVPVEEVAAFQQALGTHPVGDRVRVAQDDWQSWVAGATGADVDLMSAMAGSSGPSFDWRSWRLPITIALAVLAVNIVGLQLDWWRLRSEANATRATMAQVFRNAFPKEPVVDPVAQMRQKVAAARREAGEAAPDDFLPMAARFGQAWKSAVKRPASEVIAALDYKDRNLVVRFKPGANPPALDEAKSALASNSLSATEAPAQGGDKAWQIRSTR